MQLQYLFNLPKGELWQATSLIVVSLMNWRIDGTGACSSSVCDGRIYTGSVTADLADLVIEARAILVTVHRVELKIGQVVPVQMLLSDPGQHESDVWPLQQFSQSWCSLLVLWCNVEKKKKNPNWNIKYFYQLKQNDDTQGIPFYFLKKYNINVHNVSELFRKNGALRHFMLKRWPKQHQDQTFFLW